VSVAVSVKNASNLLMIEAGGQVAVLLELPISFLYAGDEKRCKDAWEAWRDWLQWSRSSVSRDSRDKSPCFGSHHTAAANTRGKKVDPNRQLTKQKR
jgi:hypothetical protein